jgi:hypothetical protein
VILILPTSAIEEIFIIYFFAIVAPKCKENQRIIYGAAFKSDVMVTCRVEANPMPHSFRWQFKTASKRRRTDLINTVGGAKALDNIKDMVDLPANQFTLEYDHSLLRYFEKKITLQGESSIYYMSLQYHNKSKSQLTSPTPAQLPAVALSAGHIGSNHLVLVVATTSCCNDD